jgi:hypothetical protein
MITALNQWISKRRLPSFLGAGLVSNGPTGGGMLEEGAGMILFGAVMGAFAGLLFGFILVHFLRFFSFVSGRHFGSTVWLIASMLIGAIACAWMAAVDSD